MWGSAENSQDEILFAVGNKAYPAETHYFVISESNEIFFVNDSHKKELHKKCANREEVVSSVIELLKEWFPAKKI